MGERRGWSEMVGRSVYRSVRSVEIKVQRSGCGVVTSHFFWGRGQLNDLVFRGLADDIFVFLGRGDACEFGVDLVILRDLEHGGTVLNHPCQQVRSP